ncbi:MAG TPA: DUF2971 domain-containing protein [Terriglobales bacterium]|nr:DUF2971 domain-containing protein [Terriglobales bacterium]
MSEAANAIVGCDAVNAHVTKPIPDTLWHYTSYAGFQGIVTSKKIWATEYRFLNDRQEFLHAKALAQNLVQEEPEFVGEQLPNRDTIRKAVNLAFETGHLHDARLFIMVSSFSNAQDQLSQWRGYANDSRGVSMGLDLRSLRPPSNVGTAVTFAPCVYKPADKNALLKAIFADYRKGLQSWWASIVSAARREIGSGASNPEFAQQLISAHSQELNQAVVHGQASLQFDLLRTAPLLKDENFREEDEWRLVLPWEHIKLPTNHPLEFRPVRDTVIPYIAYPLNRPGQEGPIFCKDVILGAGSHVSAETAVNLFLRQQGIQTLARRSKIPYRPT